MVKWTPKAEQDLEEIREPCVIQDSCSHFDVDLAILTVDKLVDDVEALLSHNPLAGSVVESNPLFSKLSYKGNSVFYCENPLDRHIYIVYVQGRGSLVKDQRID